MRQLLTESLLLAVCGGLLGLGVAQLGVHSLLGLIPAQQVRGFPRSRRAGLDPRVVAYALLVSLAAGIGVRHRAGAAPGDVRASRFSQERRTRGSIGGASRLRDALVVGEIALTVILMSGALLFGRSLMRLLAVDPGFRPEHVVTTTVVSSQRDVLRPRRRRSISSAVHGSLARDSGRRGRRTDVQAAARFRQLTRLRRSSASRRRSRARSRPRAIARRAPTISTRWEFRSCADACSAPATTRSAPSVCVINRALAARVFRRRGSDRPVDRVVPRHAPHRRRRRRRADRQSRRQDSAHAVPSVRQDPAERDGGGGAHERRLDQISRELRRAVVEPRPERRGHASDDDGDADHRISVGVPATLSAVPRRRVRVHGARCSPSSASTAS